MKIADIFSGAGGSSLGFALEGFRVVGGLDIDPYATASFKANLRAPALVADAASVDPRDFLGFLEAEPDVLVACPPCQGFTRMRIHKLQRSGIEDPRNRLVTVFLNYVRVIAPEVVVFENVPGMIKWRGGAYFQLLLRGLHTLGYYVTYDVLDAVNYGTPQFRKRIIVIGARSEKPGLPQPTHGDPRSEAVKRGVLKPWVTVRDAIGDLPPLRPGEAWPKDPLHRAPRHRPRVLALIKAIPKNGGSRLDAPRELWLPCHRKVDGYRDVYGRMAWDKPAPTITSGCYSPSKGRYIHPEQDRGITLREAARLQGFPDDFVFYGTRNIIARQIGNAMPVPLARALAKAVKELL